MTLQEESNTKLVADRVVIAKQCVLFNEVLRSPDSAARLARARDRPPFVSFRLLG